MSNRKATVVPGENVNEGDTAAGKVVGFGQGTTGDVKPAVDIPDDITHEQLLAAVRTLSAQLGAAKGAIAAINAATPIGQHAHIKPVTMDEAKAKERQAIENGEVPRAILTHAGWHVPELAHSNVDAIERAQEIADKAARRAAAKKARSAPVEDEA